MVGVVLIDYNSQERTVKYINELIQASDTEIEEIVVIDNSPEDRNFTNMVTELERTGMENIDNQDISELEGVKQITVGNLDKVQLILVNNQSNTGFAKANNMGLNLLKRFDLGQKLKYVLFSNSDIQFKNATLPLSILINDLNQKTDAGIIGPNIIGLNGKMQSPCRYLSLYQRWIRTSILWPLSLKWKRKLRKQ